MITVQPQGAPARAAGVLALGLGLAGLIAGPAAAAVAPGAHASLAAQALGLVATIAWSAAGTYAILWICKLTTGLRVTREQEIEGLDTALHGETLHD